MTVGVGAVPGMKLADSPRTQPLFGPPPIRPLPRLSEARGGHGEIRAGSRVLYCQRGGQPALPAYAGFPGLGSPERELTY